MKLEFPEGTGGAKQKPSVGEYGCFLELHMRTFKMVLEAVGILINLLFMLT